MLRKNRLERQGKAMDRQALNEGKERVRVQLLEPLNDLLRLRKPKRVTEAQHLAGLGELQARLAYMADADLVALREALVACLTREGAWPSPAVVLGFAVAIRRPPPSDSPMVTSYMASAAGRRAKAENCHIALYEFLKKRGRPPSGDYEWSAIKTEAEVTARRVARLTEELGRGLILATADDGFLAWHARQIERVDALIVTGDAPEGVAA
jgi:hypothetical protein